MFDIKDDDLEWQWIEEDQRNGVANGVIPPTEALVEVGLPLLKRSLGRHQSSYPWPALANVGTLFSVGLGNNSYATTSWVPLYVLLRCLHDISEEEAF